MSEAVWIAIIAAGSAVFTGWATLFRARRSGPDAQSQVVDTAVKTMTQMQSRIDAMELRISRLERTNDAYYRLFGPLPSDP